MILGNDYYNLLPAVYRFLGGKVPYICYVRFLPSKFPGLLVNFWWSWHVRYASFIVAVSQAVSRQLPANEKVIVISNELPNVYIPFTENHSQLILYLSNYIPGKGQEYALKSFALLSDKYPTWKLRFVGGDMGLKKNRDFKLYLIQLSNELGIMNQTEWMDFEEDTAKLYSEASIVLNFSESESFSMTVLEALFYGKSVIATRCGGPEELITDKIDGLLVPIADIDAMYKALEFMMTHEDERLRMANAAYIDIRIKYSKEKTIDKLAELYQKLLTPNN
jgi:glycosyltransferase involved in cell wall biosynthesis